MNSKLILSKSTTHSAIEPLEQRIAPAGIDGNPANIHAVVGGSDFLLKAGEILSTADGSGSYLLYVAKGQAVIHTTDYNNNLQVDFNEITGISAGNGLQLISFVDIHGDIVTDLNSDGTLTDSDHNPANGRDGKILLNSRIEKIELRSITSTELANPNSVLDHIALSSYSIFGNIYAGAGFGLSNGSGGLIIDNGGNADQAAKFVGGSGTSKYVPTVPQIGSIRVGSAASGQFFSFGIDLSLANFGNNVGGQLTQFVPPSGTSGADINGVKSQKSGGAFSTGPAFNIGTLQAGDGAFGGAGGSISNVHLNGDSAGGYSLIAGDGGVGNTGTAGGSIINFSDFGSITGEILLKTGDGGRALLGKGGNAGTIQFDTVNGQELAGHTSIVLGNGGDGLTAGGNGASLPSAAIVTPETVVPYALNFVSTTRQIGDIGNTRPFDFNGDGISDAVMTLKNPDQLQVLFGAIDPDTGTYGFDVSEIMYLNNPANPLALVVADFNDDGNPDIATASANASSAGVSVFLSLYNGGNFVGFSDPIQSPLPSLQSADFFQKAVPILNLAAGDFSGSGKMELALTAVETFRPPTANPDTNTVFFLLSATDSVTGDGSGRFYADMKTGFETPFEAIRTTGVKAGTPFVFRPTALDVTNPQDTLLISQAGIKYILEFDYDALNFATSTTIGLDQVDTNRKINSAGKTDNEGRADVTMQDFVLIDFEDATGTNTDPGDGFADIVVLSKAPEGFLQTFAGDGLGGFTLSSVGPDPLHVIDNQGIKVSGRGDDGGLGFENTDFVGLRALDDNTIALFDYGTVNQSGAKVIKLEFAPTDAPNEVTLLGTATLYQPNQIDDSIQAFDVYRPDPVLEPTLVGYGYAIPSKDNYREAFLELAPDPIAFVPQYYYLTHNSILVTAGDGGDSLQGPGGAGGSLGGGSLSTVKTVDGTQIAGKFSLTLPTAPSFNGTARLTAGNGGNGFTNGGAGGGLSSIVVDYATGTDVQTSGALLYAGNGGSGITGAGGNGGSLSQLKIQSGEVFVAGNGGFGKTGGIGGSVNGNGLSTTPDTTTASIATSTAPDANTFTSSLVVRAGSGANGITKGGNGGAITNFTPQFLELIGGVGGTLNYFAGVGGNAVGGPGGSGGSIVSSSPFDDPNNPDDGNNLAGDVYIQAGRGGNGTTGGAGGSVKDFINKSTIDSTLDSISILAGDGGAAFGGKGGAGGSVTKVTATGKGAGFQNVFDFSGSGTSVSFLSLVAGELPLAYNRIIAGQGGDSVSDIGGAGGSISSVTTTATSSSSVVAAGRGGDGLRGGGIGGSIASSTVNSSGTDGKVLAIAGDGGNVTGNLSIGGINGLGGTGGSISNFTQPSSTDTNVDLIAGNGGSLLTYGTGADIKSNVGKGGSITGLNITGNIGNSASDVAIRSYNDISINETMADFVKNTLLDNAGIPLTDLVGNVGLVVGEAGRVSDGTIGRGVVNGSATTIKVQGDVMSMIAGNVGRIAAIQVLSGITITQGHIVGAPKDVDAAGNVYLPHVASPLYLSSTNVQINAPQLGGKLVDGALVSYNPHAKINNSIRDFVV